MHLAFWLVPADQDRDFFQQIIDTLAEAYDAPVFVPHVTIYVGDYTAEESPTAELQQAIQGVSPFRLQIDRLLYTDQYTKTVFVQFQPHSLVNQLTESLRRMAQQPSNYEVNPHLSLIYQHLREAQKQNLVNKLSLPMTEVLFDQVSVLSGPPQVQGREDIEACQVLWSGKLTG